MSFFETLLLKAIFFRIKKKMKRRAQRCAQRTRNVEVPKAVSRWQSQLEIEKLEGENKIRFKRKRNILVDLVNLIDLPLDILHGVIQKTSLLEKHVLRFVCKKIHCLVHSISKSLFTKFHYPKGLDALAIKCNNVVVFEWVTSTFKGVDLVKIWYNTAKYGNIELMKHVKHLGYSLTESACLGAAKCGSIKNLSWAIENGCKWNEKICSYAVEKGHFEVLFWARENGCPWDAWTCCSAAKGGHFSILKWARENGCHWNNWTCAGAALRGHLEILKWARENKCPWDNWTCSSAASGGYFEALRAALARNIKMG
jgi:hypothetical protein